MPKLETLTKSNKFTKSNYRPWNFMEQLEEETLNSSTEKTLANHEQTVSIKSIDSEQTKSKPLVNEETNLITVSNVVAEPLANSLAKQKQTVSDMLENQLDYLTGKERILVNYLFKKCQTSASLETSPITTDELKIYLNITSDHLRNLIFRVSHKNIIIVKAIKNGRSGWRKFALNKDIFQQMSLSESVSHSLAMREQSIVDSLSKPLAEPLASRPSSSSLHKLTTKQEGTEQTEATSNATPSNTLPPEWASIDYSFLEDIGFNQNKLLQIYGAGHLTAEMVQESLYGFDFDRKHNDVKVNSPINFLMAQLKVKGLPYDLPKNYESPKVRAMREYLERMEANEQKEEALKQQLKTREFEKWFNGLSIEEQNTLVPPHGLYAKGSPRRAAFFKHFDENHWAEKEKVLFAGIFA